MSESMNLLRYTDLEVWQSARQLVKWTYELTNEFPSKEAYRLSSQMRRSAISVPSNIAEGAGRKTSKDTVQFLYISRGSLYELETQFYLSLDVGYITEHQLTQGIEKITETRKRLNGFINYYKNK